MSVTVPGWYTETGQFEGSLTKRLFTKVKGEFRKPMQGDAESWDQQSQGTIPEGEGVITRTQRE